MEILNYIHIFKTNINNENLPFLKTIFAASQAIIHWNVDTEDRDHVLRIVSFELSQDEIIRIVSGHGFLCEELQ